MGVRADLIASFDEALRSGWEEALFNPSAGVPIPCHVDVNFGVQLQPAGIETQVWDRGTTIEALLSEIVREPNREETFTVDSVVYTVKAILENDGLTVKAVVT